MARKKKSKSSWLKNLLLVVCALVFTPLIIWALAFVLWIYWYDISGRPDNTLPAKASEEARQPTKPIDKPAHEKIGEQDRKKLEEILKHKN
ncbi:MAG TPA: hypothetical protein VIE89_21060 [Candidatus Binatia bacterium]